MSAQHTPGPWMIFDDGDIGSAAVRTPDTLVIRSGTVKGETIGNAMANARLIAAAPELLAALLRAEDDLRSYNVTPTGEQKNGYTGATLHIIRAAIAKAGQS